jgi:chromosomal replication initiator protein
MVDTNTLWEKALEDIEEVTSKANFNTWFKNSIIEKEDRGTVYIGVPNEFVKEWLFTKYHKVILKALRNTSEHVRAVEYVISKKNVDKRPTTALSSNFTGELPLHQHYINKKSNLNPRYAFDSFVIGSFNELAYSAAQAIIHKPGVYNPLFIYGETGLGKTHLIQAIGNTLKENNPDLDIYYISSEKFTMDLVSALRNDRMDPFKEKYRKYDVFIMDDIQFLSGKDKTQEELFHLFNILYERNRQIIFSSDKHPNYILGLESRLKSRFSAGMIVDVSRPDFESKVAILSGKMKNLGYAVRDEIIEYIAQHVDGNIRELEGILNSLTVHMQLRNEEPTIANIQHLIKNNVKPKKNISIPEVVKIIAGFYNHSDELIYEKTRRKEIVRSRQITMFILRNDYSISYPHIGKELGGRDHTTVIHSCDKIKRVLEEDPDLSNEIEQIRAMLSTR